MSAMMLGPLVFTQNLNKACTSTSISTVILVAAGVLLTTLLTSSEMVTFATFCVLEAAIGVYLPSMGSLKGRLVGDGMPARVYGLLRFAVEGFRGGWA
jgi:MFS transporter, MFS domain-containing protein family, molybdate-anion transporter